MKPFICHLLAIAVLFMSTEGLWDMANEIHPHGDLYAHQVDVDHAEKSDANLPTDDCDDHCTNYCHGHFSFIPGNEVTDLMDKTSDCRALASTHLSDLSKAPPTPPPTV